MLYSEFITWRREKKERSTNQSRMLVIISIKFMMYKMLKNTCTGYNILLLNKILKHFVITALDIIFDEH